MLIIQNLKQSTAKASRDRDLLYLVDLRGSEASTAPACLAHRLSALSPDCARSQSRFKRTFRDSLTGAAAAQQPAGPGRKDALCTARTSKSGCWYITGYAIFELGHKCFRGKRGNDPCVLPRPQRACGRSHALKSYAHTDLRNPICASRQALTTVLCTGPF